MTVILMTNHTKNVLKGVTMIFLMDKTNILTITPNLRKKFLTKNRKIIKKNYFRTKMFFCLMTLKPILTGLPGLNIFTEKFVTNRQTMQHVVICVL